MADERKRWLVISNVEISVGRAAWFVSRTIGDKPVAIDDIEVVVNPNVCEPGKIYVIDQSAVSDIGMAEDLIRFEP